MYINDLINKHSLSWIYEWRVCGEKNIVKQSLLPGKQNEFSFLENLKVLILDTFGKTKFVDKDLNGENVLNWTIK